MRKNDEFSEPLSESEKNLLRSESVRRKTRGRGERLTLSNEGKWHKAWRLHKPLCILFIAFAVLLAAAILFGIALGIRAISTGSGYRVTYVDGKEKSVVKVSADDAKPDGVLTVDMVGFAKWANLPVSGSEGKLRFGDEEQYLRFTDESTYAVINGNRVEMSAPAHVTKKSCRVPLSFLMKAVSGGVKITVSHSEKSVGVERVYDDDGNAEPLRFTSSGFEVLLSVKRMPDDYPVEYETEPDENTLRAITTEDERFLMLVNPEHPLGEDYEPQNLAKVPKTYTATDEYYLVDEVAASLIAMMKAMREEGVTSCYLVSAYRSYDYQVEVFDRAVAKAESGGLSHEDAVAEAKKLQALPGMSEHQTGLCLDFTTTSLNKLNEQFESTAAFKWLAENAWKYGFILRYPKGMSETVFYDYEPWHYRFVGRKAAAEITAASLTLEDYLDLI